MRALNIIGATSKVFLLAAGAWVAACGRPPASSDDIIKVSYFLSRAYTGANTNALTIIAPEGSADDYAFSLASPDTAASVPEDELLPLASQTITFTYDSEGVHYADFKIEKENGEPYVFEILTWEYSTSIPDPPIVSFAKTATRSLANLLLISDSRISNTSGIWVGGDLSTAGHEVVDGGYWSDLALTELSLPVTLTPGDGLKVIDAKFRNVFGNESDTGIQAEILLKQTPPTGCDAAPKSSTISNNKLSLTLSVTDPYQTYYSVMGDVKAVVNQKTFADGEVVDVYVEPTPGAKQVVVYIEDVAGNLCLQKTIDVTLDPAYENEGIFVQGHTYWTDTENVLLDIYFDTFPNQEPVQVKITGDATGPNVNQWIALTPGLAVTLNPTTTGSRRVYAQYKDVNGDESYLITKRIFLKPTVTLVDAGAPMKDVVASDILDATSLTVDGCVETYDDVAYAATYSCQPNAATVDVTWKFPDGSTVTKSATP